jgi:L-iditol 2-dehydrogenase
MGFDTGALAEPAAVAVHAMNLAGNVSGRTAAILGAGPIGLITLMAFKAAGGARAICVDINEARLACASSMGADETILNKDCKLTNICDIAFETAGSPVTTAQLFAAVRPGGRAVQVGWPSGNIVPMDIAGLMEKEITYSGLNRYANAYPAAIAWLADGRIDGRKLITHRFPFAQTPEAFEFTAANPNLVIKTIVSNQ